MSDIYIVGVGMTPFGRYLDRPIKEMTRAVVTDALADAGADVADIEAAWFSNAAQAILTRNVDPIHMAVISITQFHAGTAGNVIPDTAFLNASVRTTDPATRDLIERRMGEICTAMAASFRMGCGKGERMYGSLGRLFQFRQGGIR